MYNPPYIPQTIPTDAGKDRSQQQPIAQDSTPDPNPEAPEDELPLLNADGDTELLATPPATDKSVFKRPRSTTTHVVGTAVTPKGPSAQTDSPSLPPTFAEALSKSVGPVLARCESLNAKVDRTHAKLAAGLRVNVNLLESIAKDLADVKEAIKSMTGNSAVLKAQDLDRTFPLKTAMEVDKYLEADPEAQMAMQRSAALGANLRVSS